MIRRKIVISFCNIKTPSSVQNYHERNQSFDEIFLVEFKNRYGVIKDITSPFSFILISCKVRLSWQGNWKVMEMEKWRLIFIWSMSHDFAT